MKFVLQQTRLLCAITAIWVLGGGFSCAHHAPKIADSFEPHKPNVRYYWDSTHFYVESDGMPDRTKMPNLMVGITAWQQQLPMPVSYFFSTINPESNPLSLGYQQRNVWKIPLVPVPAAAPLSLNGHFLRGAVALAANGIPIFNPRNNRGEYSYEIGELDSYGGHCGLADDYHYHIAPVHLQNVLGVSKPVAWALDGYPIYGFTEPDGSPRLALDADGGHDHGTWGYHYHARGNAATGIHSAPFLMEAMHGEVVNFGGQIDPQPTAQNMRPSPSGGYEAKAVAGAAITAFMNPVALSVDGSGHFVHNPSGVPSNEHYLMRYTIGTTAYDVCWRLNRNANPKSYTITFRHPDTGTTTTTYANTGSVNRIKAYEMAAASLRHIPDTGATQDGTAIFGEDNDYTRFAPSFTDNGNGTITDNVTGLMWQKTDNGESTWDTAVANSATVNTGGYTDWRLPTRSEAFSILNHANNPAVNPTYFPNHPVAAAGYWWTSDIFGSDATRVWCTNSGGGLGAHPKTETLSAGGTLRFHARYVRGKPPTNGHNYVNNGDGTITDTDTELMWTQVPSSAMNWTSAISYAEGLTTGGYNDWRLPNIKELQTLVDITLATSTSAATALTSIQRTLFPAATATAYWSSTPLRSGGGAPTQAWLAEFGVNTTSTPSRNSQGILSYEPFASTYPVFAVRSAPSRSISQGIATTTQTNLLPAGQRVSAVGTITATDGTTWTVPAATQFNTAAKAPDLYNDVTAVTPANITAAAPAIANAPTVVIDPDGEVITGYIFADNYFELYVNGQLVGVDPVPYTPFNSCFVKFKAKKPITYAIKLVDWEENLGVGSELNGANAYHPGDGGLFASFSDGTVTNSSWKAQSFYIAPLNDPDLVVEQGNGTHDSSAAGLQTPTLNQNSHALHYAVPGDWFSKTFDDSGWPSASLYSETQVGVTGKPAYTNFPGQFTNSGGSFIWSSNLVLDNEVIVRYTGPATQPKIQIEQPTGVPLTDEVSTVSYGTVNSGATLSKTFTIKNTDTASMSITGVTIDGTGAANFSVTTPPASTIAAGGSTTMVVQFAPTTAGAIAAAIHIASSDSSVGAAFDINLTGAGVIAAPTITLIAVTPTVPSNTDTPVVSANIAPAAGATITSATLTYSTGAQTTSTVFNETMKTTSADPWTGSGAVYPWTTNSQDGAGNIKQNTGTPNHTASGGCGLVFSKGSAATTDPTRTMVTLTNQINATGTFTSGSTTTNYIEFWVRTTGLTGTNGWSFQLAPNGTTYTERRSEFTGSNHDYQIYHYDLLATDLTSTLKMRFGYVGNGVGGPTGSSVNIDDIVVVTTSGSAPTPVTMAGSAIGGVFTAQIPAQTSGTTVTYSITATDSNGQTTTINNAGGYTTGPAPSIITGATLPSSSGGTYSQTLVASGGTGSVYTWSVNAGSTLPAGLTLSSAGVLSGTPTANGTFNFTLKVTDSAGRISIRTFTLAISGANATPPNIVIIITDDQGWGDVGYHTPAGQVPIQTPVMDSFGTTMAGSIRLERFYTTTVCSVTRACLATGRNPIRHATNNVRGIPLSEHMMPQSFKAAGYQTFMCGKWHIGGSDKNINHFTVNGNSVRFIQEGLEYAPFNRGWDSHYGQYSGAIDYFTHRSAEAESLDIPDWWLNGVQQDGPGEHTDSRGNGGWSPTLLADKAISHIQNRDPSKPMLLHLAFNSIHGPVSAPPSLITKYQNLGVTNTSRRLISAAVDGMDQEIGRVLAAIETAGIANNTVVVWFGDNGGDETKGSLNDPLRGTKGDSYDGGLREVAGIRWPGVLAPARPVISNQYLWVGDLFPTLAAAVGVTPQNVKPMDGVNMWPALLAASPTTSVSRGTPLVTDQAAPIAIYQFTDPVNGGTKSFKLRRGRVNNVVTPQLFNLTDDPYETTDLIANSAYAGIVTTLTNSVTAIAVDNNPPYIGPPMITNTVAQGGTITLYAPFTSYKAPTIQWRKGGVNVSGGLFTQITDITNAPVSGSYAATLTLTNVSPGDAGSYDVVITNVGGSTTSQTGTLSVSFGVPVLNSLPTFTKGTSQTLTWPAVPGASSYTIQRATAADFSTGLSSQSVNTPTATFAGLTSGVLYFYRATATNGTATSVYSNTVSSTQDAGTPLVAITAPTNGATVTTTHINVQGTATDTVSAIAAVTVNGVAATTADNYAHWSANVPLVSGANTITVTASDSSSTGGNIGTASISVTLNAASPVITDITTGPTSPTFLDTVTVSARIQVGGAPISQVQLLYDTGTPLSTTIWREIFANTSSNNWNGTGAIQPWTTTGGGVVRQAVSTSNHTLPVILTSCETNGTTAVTCASTEGLWPGMLVTGPNIAGSITGASTGNTTIASITSDTTFVLSQAATGTGTGLSLTAAGVTLTNCITAGPTPGPASALVTCDGTAGLINGMTLSGSGMANNATVSSVNNASSFTMNAVATSSGNSTVIGTGAAAEFNGGTANLTDSMITTTNPINASGAAGYVEFWVQTRDLAANNNCGWAFQVSPDNGATWATRLGEDWNSETVNLTNVTTNGSGLSAGSTIVTCANTAGLTTGRTIAAPNIPITCGLTNGQSSVTCTNLTGLLSGMFVTGTGIPNNTRIGVITPGTSPAGSFTLVTGTTSTPVTATATNAATALVATCFPNATISAITNITTFVISAPAYANTGTAPITASATTINHGAQLFHYDLAGPELGPQTKFRFQAAGYSPSAPIRSPRISIDDIWVATTAPPLIVTLTMFDDGLHGDGAAGDGVYAAQIPPQSGGANVSYRITVTDTNGGSTTIPISGNHAYTVSSSLTDETIRNAEFLGMPTDTSVTLNVVATVDQVAYVEYGTAPGSYTNTTPVTLFSIDSAKPEFYNPIEITIPGLQPDTEYYYRFRHRDTTATTFKTRGEHSFHTARPRGTPFVFTITADTHLDVNSDLPLFIRTMQNISDDGPDIHIDLGDIFMTDKLADGITGVPPQFFGGLTLNQSRLNDRALFFRNQFERVCHSVPFFYTQGNHEAEYGYTFNAAADKQNNIPAWNLKSRKAFYPTPVPNSFYTGNPTPKDYPGGSLGLLENYYAYEWGDALFIALDPFWNTTTNPNSADDAWQWTLGKPQYDWLKTTLQNSSAKYKFVFTHHIIGGSTSLADGVTPQFAARGGVEVADRYEWGGKNADGSIGFAIKRPGWEMPIHDLLVANKVNAVFHGHDHLYAYQALDGLIYLECPQPGTPNFTSLGSAGDGKYTSGVLIPNSGHIRVTVGPDQAMAEYVRAYRAVDENALRHNKDVSHSFTMAPNIFAPVEFIARTATASIFRWTAVPDRSYSVQWSPDLTNWITIDTVTPSAANASYRDTDSYRVSRTNSFYRVSYTP